MEQQQERQQEEYDITYLESLPIDVFTYLIDTGDITNEDLLRLCNSSSKLNKKCNARSQEIFKRALKRTYNVTDTRGYEPREFLKFFKFSIQNSYNFLPGRIQFLIPDSVIEEFIKNTNEIHNLSITIDDLKNSRTFRKIIEQHHMGLTKAGIPIINPGYDNARLLKWKPNKYIPNEYILIEDVQIPIIQISEVEIKAEKISPFKPGGHGNYFVTRDGYIKEYKDKYGRVKNELTYSTGTRYPTRQAAEPEANYYLRKELYPLYNARKRDGQDFVILGIIIFAEQYEDLIDELKSNSIAIKI